MQILLMPISLPAAMRSDMRLRLPANDASCDVVIALPRRLAKKTVPASGLLDDPLADEYVLGGYAGI